MGIFFILLEPSFIPAEFIWKYLSRTRAQPSGSRAKVRSSKVSAPAIFQKKNRRKRCVACDELAERVGFEPTDGFTRQTISSRSRYDLFDTAPYGLAL